MHPDKQKMVASRGGKAAHAKGTAHKWTPEEAALAGKLGGRARQGIGNGKTTGME